MDRDTQAIADAAGRWRRRRREREVNAIIAWSQERRARRGVVPGFEAVVASAAARHIWYPAWSRSPGAPVTASAADLPRGGRVVRCRCGGPEPCECTIIDAELAQDEAVDHVRQALARARRTP